jgi:ABC-2 type transport system permease protein
MRSLWAIYRREMGHYFVSPIAYIVVGVFLVLGGFFFNGILTFFIQQSFEQMMEAARFGGPAQMDVPGMVSRNFFAVLGSLVLFVVPMLTMGVYAEEKKRGTMELLMTSPVSDAQIVLGKYLASLTLFCIMLLPTALYQVILFLASDPRPPLRMILAGYLGILLLGGVLLAIGSFISSLTENQIVAAVLTFGVFLILWVIDLGAGGASATTSSVLEYLSIVRHYDDFTRGVIDTSNLVFYLTTALLGLFLTLRAIDSMRWRQT